MRALLDLFSSVKLGVTLLVLLFLYMSIGSAGVIYPVHGNLLDPSSWRHEQIRQRPWLEMTEFEWFHWWPFDALLALIVINIVVTTLRRIPLKPVNYGVWMIHSGVLVLIAGSVIYFGTKVEGEAPVVRRSVVLSIGQSTSAATVPESAAASPAAAPTAAPARVAAMPGNRVRVGSAERGYDIEVLSTDPEWELLTGDAKGRRAFSVNLLVTGPDGKRFMRQLIDGHPDLTEDLVFTENREQPLQRAVKVTGEKLVDTALAATLEYESTRWFYLRNDISKAWALYVRRPDDRGWTMRPIDGLPLYNDWISSRDDVVVPERMDLPVRALDLRVPPIGPTDPLPNVTFTIGGYLRYAFERSRVVAGGPEAPPNPVASFTVRGPRGTMSSYTLAALDPESRSDDGGLVRMHAVKDEAGFAALLEPPTLRIRVPSLGIDASQPIDGVAMVEPDRPMTPVGGADSGYGYRVVGLEDDVALASGSTSLAIVEVVTPKGRFRRWVFDDPALTRDAPAGSGDPHAPPTVADDSISLEYSRGSGRAIVVLVTGPDPERLRVIGAIGGAAPSVVDAELGKSVEVGAGLTLELVRFTPRAVIETKPTIVAPEQRIRDAQELFSRIKLSAPGAAPKWIPFHPFVFDSAQEKLRRTEFRPTQFRLEDGTTAEVIFGRRREPLPTEIALDTFVLTSHIGGFTGETASIRDYTSVLRFRDPGASSPHGGGWSESTPVSVNEPVEHGGYWYFQAKWDPPDDARAQGERASRGLNYTILGVGNRQGVVVQLAGVVLAVIGMLYAFYVKPVIKRRRRAEVMAELERPGAKVGARPRAVANASLLLPLIAAVLLGAGAPPSAPTSGGSSGASGVLPDGAAPTPPPSFAQRVNLEALESIAVHTEGRLKSFGSFANTIMNSVTGPKRIAGQSPSFTYLDLMLRPQAYADADVVYVKNKDVRARIAQAWRHAANEAKITGRAPAGVNPAALEDRLRAFEASGLVSENLLLEPGVRQWRREISPLMQALEGDLIRSAKQVDQLRAAIAMKQPSFLLESFRVIPPGGGATDEPWRSIAEIRAGAPLPGVDPELQASIGAAWRSLGDAWRAGDANAVNDAAVQLASLLPRTDAEVYPEQSRLWWESWYFRNGNMTRVWLVYMAAVVLLLLGLVYRWAPARMMGLGVFGIAFLLQTASVGLRWWISGRWPNSNMFEAVTTSAWMGACAAVVLEILARRTPMRSLFALGASVAGMVALMAAALLPAQLNPNISNMMPVLHDVWLYIHTNVIIFSYCLIFMAAVSAIAYLGHRAVGGAATFARVGGAGEMMALAAGGAGDIPIHGRGARLGEVLDGVTMLLMEVSFVLLWAGIAMGAIWADHSWGRPWGWDPKEVFALNTFVVFAILVHVRLFAKDKGLWTALLAVIGAGVMLFNWIVINFVITGLHSYA